MDNTTTPSQPVTNQPEVNPAPEVPPTPVQPAVAAPAPQPPAPPVTPPVTPPPANSEPTPPEPSSPDISTTTTKKFFTKTVILLILLPLIAAGGALAYQFYLRGPMNDDAFVIETEPVEITSTPEPTAMMEKAEGRFQGTVTEVSNDCIFDGQCAVKVDDVWVVADGGLTIDRGEVERGMILNSDGSAFTGELNDLMGVSVDVFAAQVEDDRYTLIGSSEYMIKVIDAMEKSDQQTATDEASIEATGETEISL